MKDLETPLLSLTEHLIRYKPQIEKALATAGEAHSFDHVVAGVLSGRLHFYPLENSFVLMELRKYGNWSAYHCFLAGGVFEEINALTQQAAENGKQLGATKLTLTGRKGFGRKLVDHGWKLTHVHMEYPIT